MEFEVGERVLLVVELYSTGLINLDSHQAGNLVAGCIQLCRLLGDGRCSSRSPAGLSPRACVGTALSIVEKQHAVSRAAPSDAAQDRCGWTKQPAADVYQA